MHDNLKRWLAQTSSWESFVEYKISAAHMANYDFIGSYDDLYISLIGKVFDYLRSKNNFNVDEELRVLGNGFQFYRLAKDGEFAGVNKDKSLLICALINYLSGYPAVSGVICKSISFSKLEIESQVFSFNFLLRRRFVNSKPAKLLDSYLKGDLEKLVELINYYGQKLNYANNLDPEEYIFTKLVYFCLLRFKENSVWNLYLRYKNRNFSILIIDLIKRNEPVWELFPSQWEAISKGLIEDNNTTVLQMPTSAGKTAVTEIVLYDFFQRNPLKKAILFAPFRALASELKNGFCRRLSKLGIKVKVIYGGGTSTDLEGVALEEASLIVSTPEKFAAVDAANPNFREKIGLVICDEGHLLDDESRGLSFELLVSSFKGSLELPMKLVYISAIVPNIEDINLWLGGTSDSVVKSQYRPSKLDYAVVKNTSSGLLLLVNPTKAMPVKYLLNNFVSKDELKYKNIDKIRTKTFNHRIFKNIAAITALKSCQIGPVALFTTQKSYVQDLCNAVLDIKSVLPHFDAIKFCDRDLNLRFKEYLTFTLGDDSMMSKLVSMGMIYHHASLTQELREKAEWAIKENVVRCIVCTNTLAEGVNLPVKTLVLHTIKRFDHETQTMRAIKRRDIKNIVGRSGRAGKSIKGVVILANEGELAEFKEVINDSGIEKVNGRLFLLINNLYKLFLNQEINNEILDSQTSQVLLLIEEIDLALVFLADFTIKDANGLNNLLEKTFGFSKTSLEAQDFIKKVVSLRWEFIRPYVETGEIIFLKEGVISPKNYEIIKKIVNDNLQLSFLTTSDPSSTATLNYYFTIFSMIKKYEDSLLKFNHKYEISLNIETISNIGRMWMSGGTYFSISVIFGISVESVVALVAEIFGYELQLLVKVINSILLASYSIDEDLILTFGMKNFAECLQFGVNTQLKLDLIECGVGDRFIISRISDWFTFQRLNISDRNFLRTYLRQNKEDIFKFLEGHVPSLSLMDFMNFVGPFQEFENLN